MLSRYLLSAAALVAITTVVVAQTDPIAARRDMMKGVGAATRTGTQMAKGDVPFDLAKAQTVLATYSKAAESFPALFPDTSKTGGQTTAAPAVWENSADFKGRFEAWDKDIKAATASVKDLPSFQAAFGNLTKACGSCHNTYRVKT